MLLASKIFHETFLFSRFLHLFVCSMLKIWARVSLSISVLFRFSCSQNSLRQVITKQINKSTYQWGRIWAEHYTHLLHYVWWLTRCPHNVIWSAVNHLEETQAVRNLLHTWRRKNRRLLQDCNLQFWYHSPQAFVPVSHRGEDGGHPLQHPVRMI